MISRGYNDRGALAVQRGRLAEAEAALQRAVRLDPSNALAHSNLGSVYEDLLRPDLAKAHYQIALAAGQIHAANNLGRLFLLEDEPEQAISVLLRAWERTGDLDGKIRYDLLKNLGWARLEQQRFNEARDHLDAAVELLPDEAPAHCLLGRFYTAREQPDRALREWEGCLEVVPLLPEQDLWLGQAKAFLARHDEGGGQ
jgi:Flp pilus assembly protein TadD